MILDSTTVDRDVDLAVDVCVAGSGAGGAVVAWELANAGRSVVVVEEGAYHSSRDFSQREDEMYSRLYQEAGVRVATDSTVLISQGRALGGSTVTSFCVCARPPRAILDSWRDTLAIPGVGAFEMSPHFERIEQELQVVELTAEQVNQNNRIVQAGAERLGFHHLRVAHNRVDCVGCGFCALGCAYDRKTDALTTHLRWASQRGAIIVPDCQVESITIDNARAVGVSGTFLRTAGGAAKLTVRAKVVVLAAGALGSPQVWLRSRLPNANQQVGRNLHLHPQAVVAGVFADEVASWRGIPQSVVVDEFLNPHDPAEGGFLLAPITVHPVALASMLPGFGADHRGLMESYPRLSLAAVMLRDRSSGSVELDSSGRPAVSYQLNDDDRAVLIEGLRRLADVYFAAGAERVVLPFTDLVELTRRGDYRGLDERSARANDPMLWSLHPQGSMRMGSNQKRSVVNPFGEAHDIRALFVADASIFPTAIAVPPQLSVMAFARRTARYIASNARRYFG
ncbi:MAG: GMC family oxidoreductase [Deltaproteobacteria bacterium]|nr:GMC family oxidoreductase [Deltaproteobacteria bacterium]MBI3387321.1 GMC family oxidoreductase [Deltaproteobacteria bacterium]